jgi:uncharacterized membrane-anchored protein
MPSSDQPRFDARFQPLHDELHARPFPVVHGPLEVAHVTVLREGWTAASEDAHFAQLMTQFAVPFQGGAIGHHFINLGPLSVRVERHQEFTNYLFFRHTTRRPFETSPFAALPAGWLAGLGGAVIACSRIALTRGADEEHDPERLACHFRGQQVVGSRVVYGTAAVWTDYVRDQDGAVRYLIEDFDLSAERAGRLVQRLVEIETYRMNAMLAMPLAREIGARLPALDQAIQRLVLEIGALNGVEQERQHLHALTTLAGEVERLRTASAGRFSATRAYHQILTDRQHELREEEQPGYQTLAEFLDRRMVPAMRTCASMGARIKELSEHLSVATDLLRTRININLEAQNQGILASVDRRAASQLRLQAAVEGLSLVAISYYALGLAEHGFAALAKAGLPLEPTVATGISLPVVVALVWWLIRRAHRNWRDSP